MCQAEESGTTFIEKDCIKISLKDSSIYVTTEDGAVYISKALIFALGVSRKKLNIPGEAEWKGKGVSYCVDCDAGFFKNKPVAVIGDGSAARSGALLMADYASEVHLIISQSDKTASQMQELKNANIIIHENRRIKKINGDNAVTGITFDDDSQLALNGIFIELGAKGVIELAALLGISMDESLKYIDVNKKQETNIPGIYAAGDICGPPWQVAKAVGEGCVAGLEAAKYAKEFRKQDNSDEENLFKNLEGI